MPPSNINRCSLADLGVHGESYWAGLLSELFTSTAPAEREKPWDMYALLLWTDPHGSATVDDTHVHLDEPCWLVLRPGQFAHFKAKPIDGYAFCFTREFFSLRYNNNILSSFSFLNHEGAVHMVPTESELERVRMLFDFLLAEHANRRARTVNTIRSYANILLSEIQKVDDRGSQRPHSSRFPQKLIDFERLLEAHLTEEKLPKFYAHKINVSENYLNKLCKAYFGKTAGSLIRDRVLIEAKRLLKHTEQTVSQVADTLGFTSVSYFSVFFKRETGMTADQYRKDQPLTS